MGSTLVLPPLVGGAVGFVHSSLLDCSQIFEGTIYGALWMTTASVISNYSYHLQGEVDRDSKMISHAIGISSFALALLSGVGWFIVLNHYCGFSLSEKLVDHLISTATLNVSELYWTFFARV